jgi:hypothetical protein
MRILVACESSGRVRAALRARGHEAWSCDLAPAEDGSRWHIQGDALEAAETGCPPDFHGYNRYWIQPWDAMIAFPPCTHLCSSGARWFAEKRLDGRQQAGIDFFMSLWNSPIPRKAMENPIGIMSRILRKPDQIIQPWMFGHGETKATCLWLQGLPKLVPTNVVNGRENRVHRMAPGPRRAIDRSRTYQGIADAMAEQWF